MTGWVITQSTRHSLGVGDYDRAVEIVISGGYHHFTPNDLLDQVSLCVAAILRRNSAAVNLSNQVIIYVVKIGMFVFMISIPLNATAQDVIVKTRLKEIIVRTLVASLSYIS